MLRINWCSHIGSSGPDYCKKLVKLNYLIFKIQVANFKRFYRQEIILAKMYEQNPQPKEAQAMLKYAKEIEQGMSDPIMDGNAMRKKQAAGGDELV